MQLTAVLKHLQLLEDQTFNIVQQEKAQDA